MSFCLVVTLGCPRVNFHKRTQWGNVLLLLLLLLQGPIIHVAADNRSICCRCILRLLDGRLTQLSQIAYSCTHAHMTRNLVPTMRETAAVL